ncbi:cyclic nucleotide-binding domain-containing protein [bacterium]|nr:cyclic nucleotide-binding domain-containing protein [bacterium]
MIPKELLDTYPKLHAVKSLPSEDHPKEFILIRLNDGASLGMTATEKRLTEFFNGERSVGEILQTVIQERIAPLTKFRDLLWDLHRYGFFASSPFTHHEEIEGWGYWGSPDAGKQAFQMRTLLGPLEPIWGRVLVSPMFHIFTFLCFLGALLSAGRVFVTAPLLSIQGSFAMALLVVVLTVLAGLLIASWFGAMVLRVAYDAPVRCAVDYRFTLPRYRLDGRRLRALTTRKALHYAVSPAVGLLFLSSLSLLLASISIGSRMEGCYHITLALWISTFLIVTPWLSNLLSRDIALRLRANSLTEVWFQSMRKALHFFIQSKPEGKPHEYLFLGWGIWGIANLLIIVRLLALLFRWELPMLVSQILQEKNQALLICLFILVGILAIAFLATLTSVLVWAFQKLVREIHDRYWPQQDQTIALCVFAALAFFIAQYFWSVPLHHSTWHYASITLSGLVLTAAALWCWQKDRFCFESLICGILAVEGLRLFLSGLLISPLHYSSLLVLILTIGYWDRVRAWFQPSDYPTPYRMVRYVWALLNLSLLLLTLLIFQPAQMDNTVLDRLLFAFLLIYMAAITLWFGPVRNHSLQIITLGIAMIHLGFLTLANFQASGTGSLTICLGVTILLVGLLLRRAAMDKAAMPAITAIDKRENNNHSIAQRCEIALTSIYDNPPAIPRPNTMTPEDMRAYLDRLKEIFGITALQTMFRHASQQIPWKQTKTLADWLPVSVTVPAIRHWAETEISALLKNIPTFSRLDDNELHTLVQYLRMAFYGAGERLIHQGDAGDFLFLIAEGRVEIEVEKTLGKEIVTVMEQGDFVGEIGFLAGEKRTATVRALTPVIALCLHRADIDEQTPTVLQTIQEARDGQSWLQAIRQTPVFEEFPPALRTRLCLESLHIDLKPGDSVWLEQEQYNHMLAVLLQGKGEFVDEGARHPLPDGTIIGLPQCLANEPLKGAIKTEGTAKLLLLNRRVFLEALGELVMPREVIT